MVKDELKDFFVVALPGLEDIVKSEIAEWYPALVTKAERGGVTVRAPMAVGLSMNQVLKTPTRILVRVREFPCRDFPKLFKVLSELTWSDWIHPYAKMEIHASVTSSRLKIKKRIEETAGEAWQAYQQKRKARPSSDHNLRMYLRLLDNVCTVSLDTSGERLHKRGVRAQVGEAPLRETIAAALVQMMSTGSTANVELIDPMMGAGTFLLEAASRDSTSDQREFPLDTFRQAPTPPPALLTPRPHIERLVGFELDKKTLSAAKNNLKGLTQIIELHNVDFFAAGPLPNSKSAERWVINNPPYGERLKVSEPLPKYYASLFHQVEKICRPDLACFLLPAQVSEKLNLPPQWRVKEKRRLSNGGIPVIAFVFERKA